MMRLSRFTLAMAVAAPVVCGAFYASSAAAQATAPSPTPPPAGGDQGTQGATPPPGGGTAPPQGGTTTTTTTVTPYGMPPATYKGPVGGGNATESSAHPVIGEEEDSFDLGGAGGNGAAYGTENGPIFLGGTRVGGGEAPGEYVVRKGDTLWGICDTYFRNPYQWPRIWSYNAQIQNPHWIYPGDLVKLRSGGGGGPIESARQGQGQGQGQGGLVDRRRQVPNETIFLRDEGFIEDKSDEDWGEITGAAEDKMFLSNFDDVYLKIADKHDVKLGEELTIFRPVRSVPSGEVIELKGTLRINQWNPKERIARAQISESLDVIERGERVGPVTRTLVVVPPTRNDKDIQAHVIASVHPHNFYGQNQVVFIDKGAADGIVKGNRMFIIRKGDAWRRTLATPNVAYRVSPESEDLPDMEMTPGGGDKHYPDEVVGELRVLVTRTHTSTCLVSQSKVEIERGDVAVARRGY